MRPLPLVSLVSGSQIGFFDANQASAAQFMLKQPKLGIGAGNAGYIGESESFLNNVISLITSNKM